MAGSRKTSKPNIRRRGDTYTWYAYIAAGDGTRRQISRGGFRTIAEAENDRIRHLTDIGQGNYVTPDRITVADFLLHEWLPARRTDLEPSTWQNYEQKIRLHVIPHIGAIGLQQLTPTDLNALYQQLLTGGRQGPVTSRRHPPQLVDRMLTLKAEGLTAAGIADLLRSEGHPSAQDLTRHAVAGILRRQASSARDTPDPKAGLSARTVLMVHGILAKALADALRWNRVYRNVAKAATRPSSKQVRNLARKTWTPDELHRFFDWLADNRYRYPALRVLSGESGFGSGVVLAGWAR